MHAGGPADAARAHPQPSSSDTNALKPDVIVLLGDFAASHKFKTRTVAPEEWSEALGELKAPLGVHAILGNHDWWDDLAAQRTRKGPVLGRRMLERVGIPVYENDVVRLARTASRSGSPASATSSPSSLAGASDGRRKFEGVDDLDGTLAKVTDDAPVILLAHEPDIFPRVPDARGAHAVRPHARRPGARCSATRRWCPRASATATPTATSSRTTAT